MLRGDVEEHGVVQSILLLEDVFENMSLNVLDGWNEGNNGGIHDQISFKTNGSFSLFQSCMGPTKSSLLNQCPLLQALASTLGCFR